MVQAKGMERGQAEVGPAEEEPPVVKQEAAEVVETEVDPDEIL
jgi:hypothetical protein